MAILRAVPRKRTDLTRQNVRLVNGRALRTYKSPNFLADYETTAYEGEVDTVETDIATLEQEYESSIQQKIAELQSAISSMDYQIELAETLMYKLGELGQRLNPLQNAPIAAIRDKAENLFSRITSLDQNLASERSSLISTRKNLKDQLESYQNA